MTIAVYSRGIDQLKLEDVKTFFSEVKNYDLQLIVFVTFFVGNKGSNRTGCNYRCIPGNGRSFKRCGMHYQSWR